MIGEIMGGVERFSRAGVQVLGRRSVSREVSYHSNLTSNAMTKRKLSSAIGSTLCHPRFRKQ